MVETGLARLAHVELSCESENKGTLLLRLSDLPSRKEFMCQIANSLWEAPIQAFLLASDLGRGGLGYARFFLDGRDNFEGIPRGHGEAVVMETGHLAWRETMAPMASRLKKMGYRPVITPHPAIVNFEKLDRRSDYLVEASCREYESTGMKVKWLLWSKGVLAGYWAIAKYPEEIQKYVDHVDEIGSPIGVYINVWVAGSFLGTQLINKICHGADDFDLLEGMEKRLGANAEIWLPPGIRHTKIDALASGVTISPSNNGYTGEDGTIWVKGSHTSLGSQKEVVLVIAQDFAQKSLVAI